MYQPREPQSDVISLVRQSALNGCKRILLSCPTGFGKTVVAFLISQSAISRKKRILFTAHRIQLADQTFKKFAPLKPSYLQGDSDGYDHDNPLQVATLQTLSNRQIETPDIVLIDEVHYGYESTLVQQLFTRFPDAIFIGLSATPVDNQGYLLEGFDTIIDKYQTGDLIDLKWLVPFKIFCPIKPDLSQVRIQAGEYVESDVISVLKKENITESAVDKYVEYGEDRKFICFVVNQDHAKEVEAEFHFRGIRVAIIIASTPQSDRERYLKDFKNGYLQGLISVEILTAGFDEPSVKLIMLVSPTKSWRKFIQCCGRGIRLHGDTWEESVANGKSDCILLDCSGAIEEHGLPTDRREFKFKKRVGKVLDRENDLDTIDGKEKLAELPEVRQIYLKQISSLLDLYDGKIYAKEADLQEDINKFLDRTGLFQYRQNSGKAFIENRWVHFTNKHGLPDNAVWFRQSSFYFGLELKLSKGALSNHQRETLPEMTAHKVLFFIVESVLDAYHAIEHVERNVVLSEGGDMLIKRSIYTLDERQLKLRSRLKIPMYEIV